MISKMFSFGNARTSKASKQPKLPKAQKAPKASKGNHKLLSYKSRQKVDPNHAQGLKREEDDNDSVYTLAPSQFTSTSEATGTNGYIVDGGVGDSDKTGDDVATAATAIAARAATLSSGQLADIMKSDNPLLPEELSDIPTFIGTPCCDRELIDETRRRIKKRYEKNTDFFSKEDLERTLTDDWTVSRFLLRCRLSPKRAARLMEEFGKFRKQFKMGETKPSDFPIEFHRTGGLFRYAPDRVGNQTLYMRAKFHRRMPELSNYFKAFILCLLEECDRANNGRGTAVVLDLTGAGLQNADPGFMFWMVYTFRDYCPKGLSYIIIYNLPWIMNATAKLAISWLSSNNKRRLRFVSGDGIRDFIAPENLPDFMGGTCEIDYKKVPEGARYAEEKGLEQGISVEESRKVRSAYLKFLRETGQEDVQQALESIERPQEDSEPKLN